MPEVRIAAEPRTEFGKGGARRTRRAGNVPAVLYGHGTPPRHISLPARAVWMAMRTDAGTNVLLDLDIDGGSELALAKAIQRDPLKGVIEHLDLILVRRGEKVVVEVGIGLTGEAVPDAMVDQQMTTLSVEAEATHIPQHFEVDISGLQVGDSITAAQVALPEGTVLQSDPESVVVHLLAAPTAEQVDAELAEAEADLGAGPAAPEGTAESGLGDAVPDTDSGEGGPGERVES